MISSFWNLCRACPSVPVEKLHSEYRSTFQWHEYVGQRPIDGNSIGANVSRPPPVIKQPSEKQVFWSGGSTSGGDGERRGKRVTGINVNQQSVNGWWLLKSTPPSQLIHHAQNNKRHSKLETGGGVEGAEGPRKSLSMGTIRAFESLPTVHSSSTNTTHKSINVSNNVESSGATANAEIIMESKGDSLEWAGSEHNKQGYRAGGGDNMSSSTDANRREYKSEYKKQFRPFSQYEYVDGRFFKKKGDQPTEVSNTPNPWYKEVIELRKKAGEYRYRGWGTELVPQHLADVYHQNVWDQVSRRSSLAALALITTTTQKSISKEEKDKENARKMPKRSLSRPNTATPKHPLSDLKKDSAEAVQGVKKKYDGGAAAVANRAARGKARSQSAGPGGRSPRKTIRQSNLSKEREILDANKTLQQRHPRPISADPSLGFSEPVIKSPPEPTRLDRKCVKSPEQIILRSPDPVNWTVPLDTTKSFTVTQNIRDAPPSPRFRAGLHGVDGKIGHHFSGQHSSAGSTKASSPLSSFSTRSGNTGAAAGLPQTHKVSTTTTGQSLAKSTTGQKSIAKTQKNTGDKKSTVLSGGDVKSTASMDNKKRLSGDASTLIPSNASTVNGFDHKNNSQNHKTKSTIEKKSTTSNNGSQNKLNNSASSHNLPKNDPKSQPTVKNDPKSPPNVKNDPKSPPNVKNDPKSSPNVKNDPKSPSVKNESISSVKSPSVISSSPASNISGSKAESSVKSPPILPSSMTSAVYGHLPGKNNDTSTSTKAATTTAGAKYDSISTTKVPTTSSSYVGRQQSQDFKSSSIPAGATGCGGKNEGVKSPPTNTMSTSSYFGRQSQEVKADAIKSPPSSYVGHVPLARPPVSTSSALASSVSEASGRRIPAAAPLPGTTLECLEDPKFQFDPPKTNVMTESSGGNGSGIAKKIPIAPPRGAIRVLEAPMAPTTTPQATGGIRVLEAPPPSSFIPPAPVASSKRPTGVGLGATQVSETLPKLPTYHVLDAPDPVEYSQQQQGQGSRTRAADVIDKARNKFDKFWGKKEDEK